MAAIHSLLNPAQEGESYDSNNGSSKEELSTVESQTSPTTEVTEHALDKRNRKKQKICKDAAVFKPSNVRGECRYPPDEFQDELLEAKHQMYEVYPIGDIATYPRHIPYNSEKKLFWEKTGRESFEGMEIPLEIRAGDKTDLSQYSSTSTRFRATRSPTPCCGTTTLAWSAQHRCSSAATIQK
jgi:hypothetical protein